MSKVVADVNTCYGDGAQIGNGGGQANKVTVLGWNNRVPEQTLIGSGATIYPDLKHSTWKKVVPAGEVLK